MRQSKFVYYFLFALLLHGFHFSFGQEDKKIQKTNEETPSDTLHRVEILGARILNILKINDSTNLQIFAGNVKLKQGKTLFYCDSCVINNRLNIFDAYGHVHINDGDTANAYSDYMQYLANKKVAYLKNNVRLTDGKGILTTPELEYDVDTKIGIYTKGGTVLNKKSKLTSDEGYYYTDLKDVFFKKNVIMTDPAYYVKTDSMIYNTENETMRFISHTFIKDSSGRTIETGEGFYNTKTGEADFGKNPIIRDGSTIIKAMRVKNDSLGISRAEGNVEIIDTAEHRIVRGGLVIRDKNKNSLMATDKPLMIIKQENDSIFITADTLFSGRLSDLPVEKDSVQVDTIKGVKKIDLNEKSDSSSKDSTNRYFKAWHHVRIFSDSLQAVSDSLFYSAKDSIFRLFTNPVVWSKENQITGDTILLYTKNKKADRLKVFENSFLVSKVEPEIYNQVKSTRMDGFFKEGTIDSVRAKGFAECIYFIRDEDSSFVGINESKSDALDIYFRNEELQKVVFRSEVTGTLWPVKQKNPVEMRLSKFKWLEDRRPKTKFELME